MVVDDSHAVWADHRHNLVAVERYVFFPSSRLQLGMRAPSLLEAGRRVAGQAKLCRPAPRGCCAGGVETSARRTAVLSCSTPCCPVPDRRARRDECANEGMLSVALGVLRSTHATVFSALAAPPVMVPSGELLYRNWDARQALASQRQQARPSVCTDACPPADAGERRAPCTHHWHAPAPPAAPPARVQVLRGVHIVFTRVIPLEVQPDTHPLWMLANSYGATCGTVLSDAVTHVVAGCDGTEKVRPSPSLLEAAALCV